MTKMEKPTWLPQDPDMTIYHAARLMSGLPVLDREHQRRAVAAHFRVRVGVLDRLIKEAVADRTRHGPDEQADWRAQ